MTWIDINDRRPPQGVRVFIAKNEGRTKIRMYFTFIARRIGNGWIDDHEEELINHKYGVITHWMPLPEPPKSF